MGTVDITVVSFAGYASATSAADQYTYLPPPIVFGLSVPSGATPPSGSIYGGTPVTITGQHLADATAVDFVLDGIDFTQGQILSDTDGQIVVASPESITGNDDTVDVTVTTPDGTSAISPADQFHYVHAPFITHISGPIEINGNQAAGFTAGGQTVTIGGFDLNGVTAVMFGNTPAASFGYDDDGNLTAVTPLGTPGTVDITVTTAIGASDIFAGRSVHLWDDSHCHGCQPFDRQHRRRAGDDHWHGPGQRLCQLRQ